MGPLFNRCSPGKRNNRRNQRFLLTLDQPIGRKLGDDFNTIADNQPSQTSTESDYYNRRYTFKELIGDEKLYQALNKLTEKQIEVLELIYVFGFKNKEVADFFSESPQNISNIHKKALSNIRAYYNDG